MSSRYNYLIIDIINNILIDVNNRMNNANIIFIIGNYTISGLRGKIQVLLNPNDVPDIEELGKIFPDVKIGGHRNPSKCISRDRVAIIVPYRNRSDHLKTFLYHIHKLLNRQQLGKGIQKYPHKV